MYNEDYMAARGRMRRGGNCGGNCGCDSHGEYGERAASASAVRRNSTWGLEGYPLASVFAPLQNFCNLYDLDTALSRGTMFKELDLPFVCGDMTKGGSCRG